MNSMLSHGLSAIVWWNYFHVNINGILCNNIEFNGIPCDKLEFNGNPLWWDIEFNCNPWSKIGFNGVSYKNSKKSPAIKLSSLDFPVITLNSMELHVITWSIWSQVFLAYGGMVNVSFYFILSGVKLLQEFHSF